MTSAAGSSSLTQVATKSCTGSCKWAQYSCVMCKFIGVQGCCGGWVKSDSLSRTLVAARSLASLVSLKYYLAQDVTAVICIYSSLDRKLSHTEHQVALSFTVCWTSCEVRKSF